MTEITAIRGVNLGGWLTLQRWITPELFKGSTAPDEYSLCLKGGSALQSGLEKHRSEFITETDFKWLAKQGIQAVRLPIGYWIFGDQPPYSGSIEHLDNAFKWAAKHKLKIILDLHGAPGSQNGKQHSGQQGKTLWPKQEANIILTLSVIDRLCKRYGKKAPLLGIGLLNEPDRAMRRGVQVRYYQAAYRLIRKRCGDKVWVVFSDGFRPGRYKRQLRGKDFTNVLIDTHQYQAFGRHDTRMNFARHLAWTAKVIPKRLQKIGKYHDYLVGEWSLALDGHSLKDVTAEQRTPAYRAYGSAQLLAYDKARAWFFWTYKISGGGPWSYRDAVEKGWLPAFK